jgi:nascent polypeptide-associated complex subunit alpha
MIPGLSQREMAKAMERMGIRQEPIAAREVIIRCEDKDIIIANPQVARVSMMGQETFQVIGKPTERPREVAISEEDIRTVMQQAGCSREQALAAIRKHQGDLAAAILELGSG